ncbi:MAG: AAA family ATPase, partial [Promethearchaeota archaeon]
MTRINLIVHEIDSPIFTEKGIAKIHSKIMRELGLNSGDAIFIEGSNRKKTYCRVFPLSSNFDQQNIIRIDSITRRNCGANIGDDVVIGKPERLVTNARVTLIPYQNVVLAEQDVILRERLNKRIICKDDYIRFRLLNNILQFKVFATSPDNIPVVVGESTTFDIESFQPRVEMDEVNVSFDDIGGLHEEIDRIKEIFQLPVEHPEIFRYLGIKPPKGILLHGPPGTGKTLIAKAIAKETKATLLTIHGPEIVSKMLGESEKNLRDIFKIANERAPAIILIDEIDSIAPNRDQAQGETAQRIVTQLLALMDGLEDRGQVVVIGTTNRLNAIDPALRRGGRFDREIKIGVPSIEGRLEILQIHTRWIPLDDVNLFEIAKKTHGFVGSDLASLVKESVFIAIRKSLPSLNLNERIPFSKLINIKVKQEHFDEALKEIHPSSLREFTIEIPDVNFKHIGGLKKEKKRLKELLEWPLKYPRVCEKLNIHPPKGILLHGPPGCGKTLIAKAIPNEINMNFISVKGSEILSKWLGESEKAISEIFMKARQCAPCIMFFDEIDAIIPEKQGIEDESNTIRRVISQLLTEMDGLEKSKDIVVLAATTDPNFLNQALLRAGRLDILIEIGLPDPFE